MSTDCTHMGFTFPDLFVMMVSGSLVTWDYTLFINILFINKQCCEVLSALLGNAGPLVCLDSLCSTVACSHCSLF